ncbi:MAG: S1 family peptidase [Pseudobdellovibrionaceae bacterium]
MLNNSTVRSHIEIGRRFFALVACFAFLAIFSQTTFASDRCSLVKIKTFKTVAGSRYYQQGVGWVYSYSHEKKSVDVGHKIVAPAHVVFEGGQIFAECNGLSFELRLKGISPTLDLAVLEVLAEPSGSQVLTSLFSLNENLSPVNVDESVLKQNKVGYPAVAYIKNNHLTFMNLGVVSDDNKAKFNYQFPQYRKSILNSEGAIRPGMSGSPLYNSNTILPVGMNLKTKINDHVSLVLPTEELIPYLPQLEKNQDPWLAKHPFFGIQFLHVHDASAKSLRRYRQVFLKNEQGQLMKTYTEPCQFGSMVETTNWQFLATDNGNSSNKNIQQKGGGSWGDSGGGGSWGDSGGGKPIATGGYDDDTYYTGDANLSKKTALATQTLFFGSHQYFLSKNVCEHEGLIEQSFMTNQKRLLLGAEVKVDSIESPFKIDDVESLLLMLLVREKDQQGVRRIIFSGDESADLKLVCNEHNFGTQMKVFGHTVDASELQTFIPARPWNDFDINNFFSGASNTLNHILLMKEKKYLSKAGSNDVVYMECEDDGETLHIVSQNHDWSYDLEISDGELSGKFSISNIEKTYEVNPKPVGRFDFESGTRLWNYWAVDQKTGAKVQVVLDPANDPLVTIRFTDIPAYERTHHGHGLNNSMPPLEYMETQWFVRD